MTRVVDFSLLGLCFMTIICVALLRGGHGVKSVLGLKECSVPSFSLLFGAQAICMAISLLNYSRHKNKLLGRENAPDYEVRSKTY